MILLLALIHPCLQSPNYSDFRNPQRDVTTLVICDGEHLVQLSRDQGSRINTHWIGADPDTSRFNELWGFRTSEPSVNSVFLLFFVGKSHIVLNQVSGHSAVRQNFSRTSGVPRTVLPLKMQDGEKTRPSPKVRRSPVEHPVPCLEGDDECAARHPSDRQRSTAFTAIHTRSSWTFANSAERSVTRYYALTPPPPGTTSSKTRKSLNKEFSPFPGEK